MIGDLTRRLEKLESGFAVRIARNDPRQRLVVACQLAAMRASVSPTPKQLERVERFKRAANTGDTNGLTRADRDFLQSLSPIRKET